MLDMFITSSVLIIVVLAVRSCVMGKIPAKWIYALWLLVAIQLFSFPFLHVESRISVLNITAQVKQQATEWWQTRKEQTIAPGGEADWQNRVTFGQQDGGTTAEILKQSVSGSTPEIWTPADSSVAGSMDTQTEKISGGGIVMDIPKEPRRESLADFLKSCMAILWAVGAVGIGLSILVSNLRFYGRLRRERGRKTGEWKGIAVYEPEHLTSPLLFGRAIYIPAQLAAQVQTRHHMLEHEYSHYRNGDFCWSILRCLCLTLYWYHPLVWVAAWYAKCDCELACDETALKYLGDGERVPYGKTLLAMAARQSGLKEQFTFATGMHTSHKELKKRIELIAKQPKRSLAAGIFSLIVMCGVVGCTFTQRPEDENLQSAEGEEVLRTQEEAGQTVEETKRTEVVEWDIETEQPEDSWEFVKITEDGMSAWYDAQELKDEAMQAQLMEAEKMENTVLELLHEINQDVRNRELLQEVKLKFQEAYGSNAKQYELLRVKKFALIPEQEWDMVSINGDSLAEYPFGLVENQVSWRDMLSNGGYVLGIVEYELEYGPETLSLGPQYGGGRIQQLYLISCGTQEEIHIADCSVPVECTTDNYVKETVDWYLDYDGAGLFTERVPEEALKKLALPEAAALTLEQQVNAICYAGIDHSFANPGDFTDTELELYLSWRNGYFTSAGQKELDKSLAGQILEYDFTGREPWSSTAREEWENMFAETDTFAVCDVADTTFEKNMDAVRREDGTVAVQVEYTPADGADSVSLELDFAIVEEDSGGNVRSYCTGGRVIK